MPESEGLKLPFIDFDYTDETSHSASFKQAILYVARIQKVFDKIGYLDLTSSVVAFIREPHIRKKLESIITETSRFDLASPELPFLFRAELVEAYFHDRIAQYVGSQESFEVYLTRGWREKLSLPVGHELLERVKAMVRRAERSGQSLPEQELKSLEEAVSHGLTREMYNIVFDGDFSVIAGYAASLAQSAHQAMGSALVKHPSQELQTAHLGGRDAIDRTLLFHAMASDREATPKEEAMYYDRLREMFHVDGVFPQTGNYGSVSFHNSVYRSLDARGKRIVHDFLLENLMDAQVVRQAMTLFPRYIDPNLGFKITLESGLIEGKRVLGIRPVDSGDEHRYVFDMDISKDLHNVAIGAQNLLRVFSSVSRNALVVRSQQSYSESQRDRHNIGLFGMLAAFGAGDDWDEDSKPVKTANAWEQFELTDPTKQADYYNAFQRLFGRSGYVGTAEEDRIKLTLNPDGSITAKYMPFGVESDEEENFGFFEKAREDSRSGVYFRNAIFYPNIYDLKGILQREIATNRNVTESLRVETGGINPLRVEEGLYFQLRTVFRGTKEDLARLDERIVALLPFVQQDHTEYMQLLGLDKLTDREAINRAYRQRVSKGKVHPDLTDDPHEKVKRANLLIELKRARDELHNHLSLGVESRPSQVSTYIGNVSQLLTTD